MIEELQARIQHLEEVINYLVVHLGNRIGREASEKLLDLVDGLPWPDEE